MKYGYVGSALGRWNAAVKERVQCSPGAGWGAATTQQVKCCCIESRLYSVVKLCCAKSVVEEYGITEMRCVERHRKFVPWWMKQSQGEDGVQVEEAALQLGICRAYDIGLMFSSLFFDLPLQNLWCLYQFPPLFYT